MRLSWFVPLLMLALPPLAVAQETTATARPVDGKPFEAVLKGVEKERILFSIAGKERLIAADDLLRWGRPAELRRRMSYLLLADGSLVAGEVKAITADHVELENTRRPGLWKPSRLPRSQVKALVHQSPASPAERERADYELLAGREAHDRLLLTSGDSLSGALLDATLPKESAAEATPVLRFLPTGAKDPLPVTQERVVAVVFGGRMARPTERGQFWLGMADGSLLLATAIETTGDGIEVSLAGGGILLAGAMDDEVEPPEPFWSRITLVQPLSPRVTYLSDLNTIGFKHLPLLSWQQEFASNRSATLSRLRAGGERFIKGIGMPATSRLAYEIPEGAKRFEAELAIDDEAGQAGSAIFRVFLEGATGTWKPAYDSKILRGGDAPQAVRVDLGDAHRLALVVDMSDHGDEQDYADWLNARFVR